MHSYNLHVHLLSTSTFPPAILNLIAECVKISPSFYKCIKGNTAVKRSMSVVLGVRSWIMPFAVSELISSSISLTVTLDTVTRGQSSLWSFAYT